MDIQYEKRNPFFANVMFLGHVTMTSIGRQNYLAKRIPVNCQRLSVWKKFR